MFRCPFNTDDDTDTINTDDVLQENEEMPIIKSIQDAATQVNLEDRRTSRPCDEGVTIATILSYSFPLQKCTQVNFLPEWKDA
jgi:hypothetical protein